MFLASIYIFWPVTGVGVFVVKKSSNTELFRGSTIPTGPISGTGSFVAENSIQPVTMFPTDWAIWNLKVEF